MFKLFGSKETINIRHGNQVLLEEKIVSRIKWEVIAIRKFKRSRENERLCGSWGTIVHEKILG
jgi:F420-0:gamma-glutamyl ligase-like protein